MYTRVYLRVWVGVQLGIPQGVYYRGVPQGVRGVPGYTAGCERRTGLYLRVYNGGYTSLCVPKVYNGGYASLCP